MQAIFAVGTGTGAGVGRRVGTAFGWLLGVGAFGALVGRRFGGIAGARVIPEGGRPPLDCLVPIAVKW
jgi:hypothetical protein